MEYGIKPKSLILRHDMRLQMIPLRSPARHQIVNAKLFIFHNAFYSGNFLLLFHSFAGLSARHIEEAAVEFLLGY
jgi:hypothetical protein